METVMQNLSKMLCKSYKLTLLLILITQLLSQHASSADKQHIWRSTDDSGTPIYSDTPTENSTNTHLKTPSIYTPTKKASSNSPQNTKSTTMVQPKITIQYPLTQQAIRSNNGAFVAHISVHTNNASSYKVAIYLNGQFTRYFKASTSLIKAQFTNLDRGQHTLSASLIDNSGKILAETPSVDFFILRHHKNAP